VAVVSLVLVGVVAASILVLSWELGAAWRLLHRRFAAPEVWPSMSLLKPMAGRDDELEENLESHAAIDYPGEWELILGVRSASDPAYAVAQAFVARHPGRARLVLQEGEPGLNPKVNQLITLTRHAKGEVIALTDSNVRVTPQLLREHAASLAQPTVGLSTHTFAGDGEETLGSAFENMTSISYIVPNGATGELSFKLTQIVGKSLAIKREALEAIGGWESVKDLLAEDQRMGIALLKAGYRTLLCPTPVRCVQKHQTVGQFVDRQSRWAMIRFRVFGGVYLEPFLFPVLWGLLAVAVNPGNWWALVSAAVWSMIFTQTLAVWSRGRGFKAWQVVLIPVRDVVFFAAFVLGRFRSTVIWRGNVLRVGENTQLSKA